MRKISSIHLVPAIIAALLTCSACIAHRDQKSKCTACRTTLIPTDKLGDNIVSLIRNAGDISVSLNDNGTTVTRTRIGKPCRHLLRFIITNPANYESDKPVYGKMMPNLTITLSHKRQRCTLAYDLGLRKWAVYDSADSLIARFDMAPGNDMARFADMLFPDNKTITDYLTNNKQ